MKHLVLSTLMALAFLSSFAQATIVDQIRIGGTGDDEPFDIVASGENYVVVGSSTSVDFDAEQNYGYQDIWVVKVNPNLGIIWENNYGGSGSDYGNELIATNDGGYLVVGTTQSTDLDASTNQGLSDALVIKLSGDGTTEWMHTFGGTLADELLSVDQLEDGYILGGFTSSPEIYPEIGSNDQQLWAIKLDLNGELVWERTYGGTEKEKANAVLVDDNGDIFLFGKTHSEDGDVALNKGFIDAWLVKVNPENGDIIWEKTYGGTVGDTGVDIIQTNDGNYALLSEASSSNTDVVGAHGGEDYWLVKIDSEGEILWSKTYGGSYLDAPRAMIEGSDGNIIMTGYTLSIDGDIYTSFDNFNIFTLKADGANGDTIWKRTAGGSQSDQGAGIVEIDPLNYIIAGNTESVDGDVIAKHGLHEIWLFQLSTFPTPIENIEQADIRITHNTIFLDQSYDYQIYHTNGQLILNGANTNTIDISRLREDIYILQLHAGQQAYNLKFTRSKQ